MINPNELISKITRPPADKSCRKDHYRFDRNERTTLFTSDEFNEMISQITPYDVIAYGELDPFYEKIKDWLNISRNQILLTSGSDTAIKAIFQTFIGKKDKVLITLPNYAMFSVYNKMYGGIELAHYYKDDLNVDVDELLNKLNKDLKMLVISNPGHTGNAISSEKIIKIIERANHNNILVVIDEAYFHFHHISMIRYINNYKNLIITRTFSKAIGLASLRIGLLISNSNLINELYKVKLVHEITGVAAKIGSYMIDNFHIVDNYVNQVNEGKKILIKRFSKMNIEAYESDSNFLFFKMNKEVDVNDFLSFLLKRNIYIKGPFLNYPFNGQLRITVGDINQMEMFCDVVKDYLNSNSIKL